MATDPSGDAALPPLITGTTAATLVVETPSAPVEFLGFGVMNCELTYITMDCINWVTNSEQEADGGYINWTEG